MPCSLLRFKLPVILKGFQGPSVIYYRGGRRRRYSFVVGSGWYIVKIALTRIPVSGVPNMRPASLVRSPGLPDVQTNLWRVSPESSKICRFPDSGIRPNDNNQSICFFAE